MYHAGVDLYPLGKNPAVNTPDKANVYAIADGIVKYIDEGYPGWVLIIEHNDPLGGDPLYALYGHLDDPANLNENDLINKGDILGKVRFSEHTGNFPEFHPDDDSHLHFEIRTFPDATTIGLPLDCQVGAFGPGYTYPALPATYGYLDPLQVINQRIPKAHHLYLPVLAKSESQTTLPTCQDDVNLLANSDFEQGLQPAPWLEISSVTPHFIQDKTVFEGDYSAQLGNWPLHQIVDDMFVQSFQIPADATNAEINLKLKIVSADNHLTINDVFHITLNAQNTNLNLLTGGGWWYDNRDANDAVWYNITLGISGLQVIAGQFVTLSFSAISDANGFETAFILDEVIFTTQCQPVSPKTGGEIIVR